MMASSEERSPLWGWETYFEELYDFIASLDGDRMSFANERFTDYVIDRLRICVNTLSRLIDHLQSNSNSIELDEDDVEVVEYYQLLLNQLLDAIRRILSDWQKHFDHLQVRSGTRRESAFQVSSNRTSNGPGRPKFGVTKEQLEYLSSMSFSWTQISQLLGVSRMTVYRRRVEFGLLNEPTASISTSDLLLRIQTMRREFPEMGETLLWGRLRSMGVQVTRERIRNALRQTDPLAMALRWRGGLTRRRVYSVPGPNSLWHIGKQSHAPHPLPKLVECMRYSITAEAVLGIISLGAHEIVYPLALTLDPYSPTLHKTLPVYTLTV